VVLVGVGALLLASASPAFAQFAQPDLTGTWALHGLDTANDDASTSPGTWLRGSITVTNTGAVLPGTLELADGGPPRALTSGRLTLGPSGVITGPLDVAGTIINVRATMTPDKNAVVGVADDRGHLRDQTFALVRAALNFSTSDLAGQWLIYGLSVPAAGSLGGAGAHGVLAFDDTGAFSTLVLRSPRTDGSEDVDQLNGGTFTISSTGDIQASLTGSENTPPLPITYTVAAAMDPSREMIVGVVTRNFSDLGTENRSFFVALKSNANALAITDLAGTWRSYVHFVLQDHAPLGSWLEGPLTIRATDGALSGTLHNADGSGATITGTLAVGAGGEPDTQLSGNLLLHLPVPGVGTVPLSGTLQGRMSPARDRIGSTVFVNVVGPGGSATIHALAILVRPPVSTVQFAAPTYTVRENGVKAQITLSRTGTAGGVSVEWATTTGGTATAGADYTAASGTLTFPNNATTATFTIDITDNFVVNPNKTVNLVIRNPQGGAVIGPRSTAQLTILDDEQVVQFDPASANLTVNEGAPAKLTLTRTGLSDTAITVPVVIDTGGTAVSAVDYPASLDAGIPVAFAAGQKSKMFTVPTLADKQRDGVKTLRLKLGTPAAPNILPGAQQTSTVTIIDNESGVVKFAAAASSIVEGGTAKITVTRVGSNLQDGVEITYAVVGGTAAPADYTIPGSHPDASSGLPTGTLSFARGQTTQTITVQTTPDTIAEPSETVIIELGNPQGLAVLVASTRHTLTITDNDIPGVIHFKTSALTVLEPPTGTRTLSMVVMRDGNPKSLASNVTVDWGVTGGTGTSASGGTLEFAAGETTKSVDFLVFADNLPEGNETIVVTLTNPTGRATLGKPSVMTITIIDYAVFFATDTLTVSESTRSATVTVLRSGDAAGGFTIPVTIGASSTAVAGQDYPATFSGATATFKANQTSATVVIPLLNDTVLDGSKTLVLELGTPVPLAPALTVPAVGPRRSMTIFLNDDETPGQIGFALPASTVNEGAKLRIQVNRSGVNLAGGVTVDYRVVSDPPPTATEGVDFTIGGTGSLTFGPGATTAFIEISTVLDTVKEPSETFTLQLSNPSSGATLIASRTSHVVTIRDMNQSGVIQWAAAVVNANEEGGPVTLTIQRTGTNLAQDVSVSYALDPINRGTATPDVDYSFAAGTVTFGAGEKTKTVTLTPINDDLTELTETIRITLNSPTGGATLGPNKTIVVNLVDGVERFNGRYAGTFSGAFPAGSVSGTEAFSVTNAVIAVSRICGGSGVCDTTVVNGDSKLSFNGDATFTLATVLVGGATCDFTGKFSASATAASAAGTWTCDSQTQGPGQGSWRATRTSLTP
jgi:hypothetical protein